MIECWRWYGELDAISLDEIAQTGARGIVTALHEIPYGVVWPCEAIAKRKATIQQAGFEWTVVESLPIHESIKRGEGELSSLFQNYRQSMANLASLGIKTICYNFMPLLDWTRTELAAPVATGGHCLRFDAVHMAAFEIHMLKRTDAENDYPDTVIQKAAAWFQAASDNEREGLLKSIMAGMPGAFDRYDIPGLQTALKAYDDIDRQALRANYQRFLNEIMPTAQELGIRMCVHPDDPPRDILGLPRIVSSGGDLAWIMAAYDAPANGVTLCSGSLGASPQNDVPAITKSVAERVHFVHLRNVSTEQDGSFEEAAHLEGDVDMVSVVSILLGEQERRKQSGRSDWQIPFRPDHGHHLLSDLDRDLIPGYPLIGRMRGLAEMRGVIKALAHA